MNATDESLTNYPTKGSPAMSRKPQVPVRGPVMELLRQNIGVEFTLAELEELTGGSRTGISGVITSLMNNGWQIAVPQRGRFICYSVGSLMSVPAKDRSTKRPHQVLPTTDPLNRPASGTAPQPTNGERPLRHGDLLEVIFISRAGTVIAECERGRRYEVREVQA